MKEGRIVLLQGVEVYRLRNGLLGVPWPSFLSNDEMDLPHRERMLLAGVRGREIGRGWCTLRGHWNMIAFPKDADPIAIVDAVVKSRNIEL